MASILPCDCREVEKTRHRLRSILQVIDTYRWIIDGYVSDFHTKDHWSRLPSSWQHFLENLSFAQLASLLTGEPWCSTSSTGSVSPLSLLALKQCVQVFSLHRRCVDLDSADLLTAVRHTLLSERLSTPDCETTNYETLSQSHTVPAGGGPSPNFKNGQLLEMEHIFRKHVKPKKQHEIQRLAKVISWLCGVSDCHHVVDVGAGLGHLSRLLTFGHGLKVTTVEATDGHAPKASEFDRELEKDILKKLRKTQATGDSPFLLGETTLPASDCLPSHVVCTVPPDITTQQFLRLVVPEQSDSSGDNMSRTLFDQHLGAPGLHPAEDDNEQVGTCLVTQGAQGKHFKGGCDQNDQEQTADNSIPNKLARIDSESQHDCRALADGSKSKGLTAICHCSADCQAEHTCPLYDTRKMGANMTEKTAVDCTGDMDKAVKEKTNAHNQAESSAREDGVHTSETAAKEAGEVKETDVSAKFVLAGLHACGDLTATLLRVFVNCGAIRGLVSVACCYMKLTCDSDLEGGTAAGDSLGQMTPAKENGYPMSDYLSRLKTHPLTYEAREMACHFADAYAKRLQEGPVHLKIHGYRAALQYMVTQLQPDFQAGVVRLIVKKGAEVPFAQYAQQCFQKLGISIDEVPAELMEKGECLAAQWHRVVAFYTLRLSLAPLVETLVLLDRLLYLAEHGLNSVLVPVFDSSLSPRNFALLACKKPSLCETTS